MFKRMPSGIWRFSNSQVKWNSSENQGFLPAIYSILAHQEIFLKREHDGHMNSDIFYYQSKNPSFHFCDNSISFLPISWHKISCGWYYKDGSINRFAKLDQTEMLTSSSQRRVNQRKSQQIPVNIPQKLLQHSCLTIARRWRRPLHPPKNPIGNYREYSQQRHPYFIFFSVSSEN